MAWVYFLITADAIVGLVVAVIAWVANRAGYVPLGRALRVQTVVVMATGLVVQILVSAWTAWPFWTPSGFFSADSWLWVRLIEFGLPTALAVVMVVVLAWPAPRPVSRGIADLEPRGIATFTRPRWLWGFGAILGAVVAVTVIAGVASQPDDEGRYLLYGFDVGSLSFGTSIYGWFFSIPCLVAVLLLVVATVAGLARISRPPLGPDREFDARSRRSRARNVLAAVSGGLLLHLGSVLDSLGGTASLGGMFTAGEAGTIDVGTPFAALGPALAGFGFIATCLGFVLWWFVLLSVIPLRVRTPVASR
jgi:hypothetical protein